MVPLLYSPQPTVIINAAVCTGKDEGIGYIMCSSVFIARLRTVGSSRRPEKLIIKCHTDF